MASSHQYPPHTFHHHFTSHHHIHGHHTYSPSTSPNSSRFRTTPSPPTYITSTSTSPGQHRSPHLYPTSLSTSITSTTSQPERRRSSSSSSIPIRSRSTSLLSSSTSSSPHDKMSSPIIPSPHQHFRSISTDTRVTPPTPIPSRSVPTSTSSKPINAPSSAPNVQRTNVTTKSAVSTPVVSSTTAKSKPDPCAGQPPISPRLLNDILTLMEKTQHDLSTRLIHLHTSNKQKKERLNQLQSQFTLLQPSTHTLTPILPDVDDDDDANDYIVVNSLSQQDDDEDEPYSKNFCNTTFTCAAAAKEVMNTMTSTYLHHINMAEIQSKKLDDEIHEIQTKLHGMRLRMKCLGALSCHVKLPEYQQHIDNMKLSANKRATTQ